jgi:hypothetical protein
MKRSAVSRSTAMAYAAMLFAQTLLVGVLFRIMIPIFQQIVSRMGEVLDIHQNTLVAIIGCAVILQCCYWARFLWVRVHTPFHNIVVAHLLMFLSRASFFFGGALFSVIFFRHIPEMAAFPPIAEMLARTIALFGCLFALFCYSLELERLGRAMEEPHRDP